MWALIGPQSTAVQGFVQQVFSEGMWSRCAVGETDRKRKGQTGNGPLQMEESSRKRGGLGREGGRQESGPTICLPKIERGLLRKRDDRDRSKRETESHLSLGAECAGQAVLET